MVEYKVLPKAEIISWVHDLHSQKPSMALGMLLAGDRFSCITETVVAKVDGQIVGISTIAPDGEQMSGEPTIVAVYVLHDYRQTGIGYQLFETAIDHMTSIGLTPIRVDILNSKIGNMISRLPAEKNKLIKVVDMSMGGAMDFILES